MSVRNDSDVTISPARVRVGVLLLALWWLPVYLTVPALVAALGDEGNAHAEKMITVWILVVQGAIGLAGVLLLGKAVALTIKRVSLRRLPRTMWRIVWSGDATIAPGDLKPPKRKRD